MIGTDSKRFLFVPLITKLTFLTLCLTDLARCQAELTELAQLIQRLHWLEGGLPITNTDLEMRISMQVSTLVTTECVCDSSNSISLDK